jgi:hypothetical protein
MSIRPAPNRARTRRKVAAKQAFGTAANIGPVVARTTSGAGAAGQSR